jgi:spermidine synthase
MPAKRPFGPPPRQGTPHGLYPPREWQKVIEATPDYAPRMPPVDPQVRPVVVDCRAGVNGELVLRRAGADHEVIANGTFLMDTRDGRSERALVREAVAGLRGARVLLGGLGVGFSLDEALRAPEVAEVVVVELEPAVVDWARTHLRPWGGAGLDDPRVRLVVADLGDALQTLGPPFDAVCLDVDNGPGWVVHERNHRLYDDSGLASIRRALLPGGRLAVWASAADPEFEARLRRRFGAVRVVEIPVPRGTADVIYLAEVSPSTSP